ncbi:MAG TPA: FCD domain-containing protein [Pedomonas sp.]|uniref:FadR/GntR family transcriptional regulator n=1 Tax=Pedomonas sp. TaxID=2976421 RepID=UPI002F3E2AAF
MTSRSPAGEVVKRLRTLLRRLRLGPQDRVPPERVLAAELGCSRETVRRALQQLEGEGTIWRHQGKGTFIGPAPAGIERPVHRVVESASISDLIEARLVYEPALAAAAAQAATPENIKELRELAIATGAARDWWEYERLDDAFHKAVARASSNPLLAAIFTTLASVRGRASWQRRHDAMFRKARKEEYAARQSILHLAVVDAIAAGDGDGAYQAMRRHLETIRGLLEC